MTTPTNPSSDPVEGLRILYNTVRAGYVSDSRQPHITEDEFVAKINRLLVEAEKRGYIQGGIDEILRHEEATKAVSNQLNEEG